jgi:hypothetical protein
LYASYGTTAFFVPIPVFENLLRTSAVDVDKYVPQWIAVKDKLPDEIGKVLVIDNGKVDINSWAGKYEGWYYANKNITHWMPLPELPKEKNNE